MANFFYRIGSLPTASVANDTVELTPKGTLQEAVVRDS